MTIVAYKMFSCLSKCICKGSQQKVFNPMDCKSFVPPISSGQVIKVYDGDTIFSCLIPNRLIISSLFG